MGTTKRRQSKRNNSRQSAVTFLSNITLGNEHEVKKSSSLAAPLESPTTAQYHEDCTSPSLITSRPSVTQYGTLSVSNNINTKGILLDSSDSNSTLEEQQTPIKLTVDTSLPSTNSCTHEPLSSTNSFYNDITPTVVEKRRLRRGSTSDSFNINSNHRRFSSSSSASSEVVHQYKLTREDSQRPIASEKVKKRSDHHQDKNSETGSTGFMSVFRYYKGFIRQPRRRSENPYHHNGHNHHIYYHSYFQQHAANLHIKHRKALSYGHFLSSQSEQVVPNSNSSSSSDEAIPSINLRISSSINHQPLPLVAVPSVSNYKPYNLDDSIEVSSNMTSSQNSIVDMSTISPPMVMNGSKKKELNEIFRKKHPEIPQEITFSKISAIKSHLLNIGKVMDLEISSISHAFVYFEKLIQKQIVNKQNRKLLAACCLFLATKVNEPKGAWFKPLLEAIHSELNISSKDVRDHEFAVFADLEFNLYVPLHEFMPHFDRMFSALGFQCLEDYIGNELFYKTMDHSYEIVGAASDDYPTAST